MQAQQTSVPNDPQLTPAARRFLEETTMKSIFGISDAALDTVMALAYQLYQVGRYAEASATSWGLRTGAECALFLWAWLAPSSSIALGACLGALAVGTVGLVVAFVQNRRWYLDAPAPALPAKTAVV